MRELQQNLKKVIARVERGEVVELTKRRRVVARLVPAFERKPVPPWPDLEARARAIFGDRILSDPSPSEMLIRDREERWVTTYFDSSVIVAAYVQEPLSRKARKALSAVVSAPFAPILDLEVRTVFRRMAGSNRLAASESAGLLSQVDDDVAAGRLLQVPVDLYAMFARAELLSARYASRYLARSLDILHVAAALELGCTRFVTLDARQSRLAAACGLKVVNLRTKATGSRPS